MYLSRLMKFLAVTALLIPCAGFAANDSSRMLSQNFTPKKYQSYVDTSNCIELKSSPYVIVAGNGGANMDLSCPSDKPVMYRWKQKVGFGGFGAVTGGGGDSRISCCAVGHKWES